MKKIGILALQGGFSAHEIAVSRAGATPLLIREARLFDRVDALVIPGGESTTMLKLMQYDNMFEALEKFAREKPIFGTCAGAILMAKGVSNPSQESLGAMDIDVERNAYGRQNDSCIATIEPEDEDFKRGIAPALEAVFIRAPIIRRTGKDVKVLARYKGNPVLVEQGMHMAATFHPELSAADSIHALFLRKVR